MKDGSLPIKGCGSREKENRQRMPEYKRFIAYFYEYIDGKRQRNAGFLKAERRGDLWRLQLQLRAGRWPEEGLQIFGYVDEGKHCPVVLLGRAYAQKENLTKRLQFGTDTLGTDGLRFENLSGIWIPCDKRKCYISHWLEGEMRPERLIWPEKTLLEEAAQMGSHPKETPLEEAVQIRPYPEKIPLEEAVQMRPYPEKTPAAEKRTEPEIQPVKKNEDSGYQLEEQPSEQAARSGEMPVKEEPAEKAVAEGKPAEKAAVEGKTAEKAAVEEKPAEDIPVKGKAVPETGLQQEKATAEGRPSEEKREKACQEKKSENNTSEEKRLLAKGSVEPGIKLEECPRMETCLKEEKQTEQKEEMLLSDSKKETEDEKLVGKPDSEKKTEDEKPAGKPDSEKKTEDEKPVGKPDLEKEKRTKSSCLEAEEIPEVPHSQRLDDWLLIQQSHRSMQPFETEEFSCLRICPRDIMWLRQRGWPVGRNSFLMQGFWQFRHLILAKDGAGDFFLCVPGQENAKNQPYATAFGFPEFRRAKASADFPGNFGYWCRRLAGEEAFELERR